MTGRAGQGLRAAVGFALALLPCVAHANGFVNAADLGHNGGTTSSLTTAYTVTSGSDLLIVGLTGDLIGAADNITGVTYNGSSMTLAAKNTTCGNGTHNRYLYMYYLTSPTSGSHNVVVSAGSNQWLLAGAAEYAGTNTSTPLETTSTGASANGATSLATSTTTTVANDMLVQYAGTDNGGQNSISAGSNGNLRAQSVANRDWALLDTGSSVPTGTTSETVNFGNTNAGGPICSVQMAVEFNSAVNGPENLSKLVGFAVLNGLDEQVSKVVGFAVLNGGQQAASKIVGFAVLTPSTGASQKLMLKSGPF